MPNPFAFGGRITDPSHFVGRKLELQRIFGGLETSVTGQLQHISIVGSRRIGKSSLLYHTTQIYGQQLQHPEKYRFVYVDLDNAHCHTLNGLLAFILTKLELQHPKSPTLAQFQEAIEQIHQKHGIYVVLCLDEFEHLTKRKEQFPNEVFEVWRSLGSNSRVAFVTASQTSLGELIQLGNLTSTFHNIFTYLPLGVFTEDDANNLLGLNTDRPFTSNEKRQLIALSERNPAKLQIAASLLYQSKYNKIVDWRKLRGEYERQINSSFQQSELSINKKFDWLEKRVKVILTGPYYLGRLVLDLFGRHEAKDSSATMLGWAIIGIIGAILLGVLNTNSTLELLKQIWRFFVPDNP